VKKVGIDIGSLYLGSVVIENDEIVDARYKEHRGNIHSELSHIFSLPPYKSCDGIGFTGNFSCSSEMIDSTLSLVEGARFLAPGCRSVFAIGGETFALISYDSAGTYREHAINPPCAAGTGSFIEQQAERLNLSVAELSDRASNFRGKTPLIATRCAVFAKTDIVHAMQEGYSLDAICAGLCEGIARNVLDVLVKGREIHHPVPIICGVSQNRKIVQTIEAILDKPVTVPEHAHLAGAVGAALLGKEKTPNMTLIEKKGKSHRARQPLKMSLSEYPDFNIFNISIKDSVETFLPLQRKAPRSGVFIGIDVGSTSTKAAIINPQKEFVGGFYTATGGEPVAAVKKLIWQINDAFGENGLDILGVATTGSGRMIVKELFNADMAINEITTHAEAALFINPEVDTIIEIGGQDSKFTRIRDGDVYYSTMNYVCAAGTGSFIEEQAKRLGVSLGEFSDMAFDARAPFTSDRCTVYMERDLSALLGEGWSKKALAAAVLNSVRDNYLAKVVSRTPLGDYIVFQGATGRNTALIAAFEQSLQKRIHVSPLCHLTGAFGAALLCLGKKGKARSISPFIWEISELNASEEICRLCSNNCLLTVVERNGVKSGWGMKCGRDYNDRQARKPEPSEPEKRFEKFAARLISSSLPVQKLPVQRPTDAKPTVKRQMVRKPSVEKQTVNKPMEFTIGIPRALYNLGYAPLWHNFLSSLGFRVHLTDPSRHALASGKALINSDFCAPMVLAHGYINQLLDDKTDYIFYPSVANEEDPEPDNESLYRKKTSDAYYCYYSQYLPTIVNKLTSMDVEQKLIAPQISFNRMNMDAVAADIHRAIEDKIPIELDLSGTKKAFLESYRAFLRARREYEKIYDQTVTPSEKPKIVLLGRPYVVFDPVLNQEIPRKLEDMGAALFWQEELPIGDYRPDYGRKFYERMHWHYGKQILKAVEFCARSDDLFAVYLTCFRCSPDSFLISYIKDIMTYYEKPFLILQLDEHSSGVGYRTRIEAGLESFRNFLKKRKKQTAPILSEARNDSLEKGDTVLIPSLDHLTGRFWEAAFRQSGYGAQLLEADERALNTGYLYTNGGECMPLVSIIGGVIEKIGAGNINPEKAFFYMPTLCMACNLPHFPILADLAFRNAGIKGLKIGLINMMSPGEALPPRLAYRIVEANIIGGILYKIYHRIAPYERHPGMTWSMLCDAREKIAHAILQSQDLRCVLSEIVSGFRQIPINENEGRKPRIGLLGDLYVKYNDVVNQRINEVVRELGGELVVTSLTEYPFHFYDADIRLHGDDPRHFRLLKSIEHRYERIAGDLIGNQVEPDFTECVRLMEEYRITHYIVGETSINIGRALYFIKHGLVDAILHINPIFCCPGVVTTSIYRKMQEDFQIPIIDIFYDGTGNPNRILVPHLHYLKQSVDDHTFFR
jgi:predicted CoA-substrate-specific enzyme activase